MEPILLYSRLEDVSGDVSRAITHLASLTEAERCILEALWVRLDDLVKQLPEALHEQQYGDWR